jgi:TonB family protein
MRGQDLPGNGSAREPRPRRPAWDEAVSRYLVSRAARGAPAGLAARLEEEWLADLGARRGAFSRIRFGLGCCWATRIIARDFASAAVAAGGSASGQRLLIGYGGYDVARLSRRTTAMIAIVCLHAAVFYAYLIDRAPGVSVDRARPMTGRVMTRHRSFHEPASLQAPRLTSTALQAFPPPHFSLDLPAAPRAITAAHPPRSGFADVRHPAPEPVAIVTGGPGAGFPDTENYYPPAARRLGEAGAAAVRVCVDPNGKLTADPTIVRSSGIARLDRGALRLARAGSGHYRPSTENGRPVAACYAFRIRFRLDGQ